MRQIRRRWCNIGRSGIPFQNLLRSLVVRVGADGSEQIPEASPLVNKTAPVSIVSAVNGAVPWQHWYTFLRGGRGRRGAGGAAPVALLLHQGAGGGRRKHAGRRRCAHFSGAPTEQGCQPRGPLGGWRKGRVRGRRTRR